MSATGGGSGRRPGDAFRRFVAPVARYAGQAMFVTLGFPVRVLWFVVLLTLASFESPLLAVLVGFPILALAALVSTLAARSERWRVRILQGVCVPSPYSRPPPGASRLHRLRTRLLDPALWRDLAYVLLLLPIGVVQLVVVLLAFSIPYEAIHLPASSTQPRSTSLTTEAAPLGCTSPTGRESPSTPDERASYGATEMIFRALRRFMSSRNPHEELVTEGPSLLENSPSAVFVRPFAPKLAL